MSRDTIVDGTRWPLERRRAHVDRMRASFNPVVVLFLQVEYASSMCHSNIVRLLDVFAEGKQLILVVRLESRSRINEATDEL